MIPVAVAVEVSVAASVALEWVSSGRVWSLAVADCTVVMLCIRSVPVLTVREDMETWCENMFAYNMYMQAHAWVLDSRPAVCQLVSRIVW